MRAKISVQNQWNPFYWQLYGGLCNSGLRTGADTPTGGLSGQLLVGLL